MYYLDNNDKYCHDLSCIISPVVNQVACNINSQNFKHWFRDPAPAFLSALKSGLPWLCLAICHSCMAYLDISWIFRATCDVAQAMLSNRQNCGEQIMCQYVVLWPSLATACHTAPWQWQPVTSCGPGKEPSSWSITTTIQPSPYEWSSCPNLGATTRKLPPSHNTCTCTKNCICLLCMWSVVLLLGGLSMESEVKSCQNISTSLQDNKSQKQMLSLIKPWHNTQKKVD